MDGGGDDGQGRGFGEGHPFRDAADGLGGGERAGGQRCACQGEVPVAGAEGSDIGADASHDTRALRAGARLGAGAFDGLGRQ